MLIDDSVPVGVSMQSFDYAVFLGVAPTAVTDVFLSHPPRDHYAKSALLDALEENGMLSEHVPRIANHIGFKESAEILQTIDMISTYDGMAIEM